jgi:hypothetical protein
MRILAIIPCIVISVLAEARTGFSQHSEITGINSFRGNQGTSTIGPANSANYSTSNNLSLGLHFDTLSYPATITRSDTGESAELVGTRPVGSFSASGAWDGIYAEAIVPYAFDASTESQTDNLSTGSSQSGALSDVNIAATIPIIRRGQAVAGVRAFAILPTGDGSTLSGDGVLAYGSSGILSFVGTQFSIALEGTYIYRPTLAQLEAPGGTRIELGSQYGGAAGVGHRIGSTVQIEAGVQGLLPVGDDYSEDLGRFGEAMVKLRGKFDRGLSAEVGIGLGLGYGFGVPESRAFAGFSWSPSLSRDGHEVVGSRYRPIKTSQPWYELHPGDLKPEDEAFSSRRSPALNGSKSKGEKSFGFYTAGDQN